MLSSLPVQQRLLLEICEGVIGFVDVRPHGISQQSFINTCRRTLHSCSLARVCCNWVPKSRIHLFRCVSLASNQQAASSMTTVSTTPQLGVYVQALVISLHDHSIYKVHQSLPPLLPNLTHYPLFESPCAPFRLLHPTIALQHRHISQISAYRTAVIPRSHANSYSISEFAEIGAFGLRLDISRTLLLSQTQGWKVSPPRKIFCQHIATLVLSWRSQRRLSTAGIDREVAQLHGYLEEKLRHDVISQIQHHLLFQAVSRGSGNQLMSHH